jgi:hypothetical protein
LAIVPAVRLTDIFLTEPNTGSLAGCSRQSGFVLR